MNLKPKDWKKLIGTEIGLVPTGNSVKRGTLLKDQVLSEVLTKVGRTNLTVNESTTFNMYGDLDSNNYGFLPFPTKTLAEEHLEALRLSRELKSSNWGHLSLEEVQEIEQILNN